MKKPARLIKAIIAVMMTAATLPACAYENESLVQARAAYRYLLDNDAAFAESEKHFNESKALYLAQFTEKTRQLANRLLGMDAAWDIPQLLNDRYAYRLKQAEFSIFDHDGEAFEKERQPLYEYMRLVSTHKKPDKGWLILMRPICHASGDFIEAFTGTVRRPALELINSTLSQYKAWKQARPLPDNFAFQADNIRLTIEQRFNHLLHSSYHLRTVGAEDWGAILNTGVPLSLGENPVLGCVVTPNSRLTDIQPIVALPLQAFFPSLKSADETTFESAFWPDGKFNRYKAAIKAGPRGEIIRRARLKGDIEIINSRGPFLFRLTGKDYFIRHKTTDKRSGETVYKTELAHLIRPECNDFHFQWNRQEKQYHWGSPTCLPAGQWGATSPFNGQTLIPVANAFNKIKSPRMKRHQDELRHTSGRFFNLFTTADRAILEGEFAEWQYERQFALLNFIDDEKSFIHHVMEKDQPVLDYMNTVISLSKQPDARLIYLLEPLHETVLEKRGWEAPPEETASFSEKKTRPEDYYESLTRSSTVPEYVQTLHQRMLPLVDNKAAKKRREHDLFGHWHKKGEFLPGSRRISLSYSRIFGSRISARKEPTNSEQYEIHRAAGNDYWGLATVDARYSYGPNKKIDRSARHITRIHKGKIEFLTPELPSEQQFFRSGMVQWPGLEALNETGQTTSPGHSDLTNQQCHMLPALKVDTGSMPFAVQALDLHIPFETGLPFFCEAQCSIPYHFTGRRYHPAEPVCKPDGEWGVTLNTEFASPW